MASVDDVVASLTTDDIPVKLRCAACNGLANNAYKMPCCDQSICEDCHTSLPQACPICLHEPVSKDDCRPNKALRITVKAFLKRKTIEYEAAKKKEQAAKAKAEAPVTTQSADEPATTTDAPTSSSNTFNHLQDINRQVKAGDQNVSHENGGGVASEGGPQGSKDAPENIPQKSIESPGDSPPPGVARATVEANRGQQGVNGQESMGANAGAMALNGQNFPGNSAGMMPNGNGQGSDNTNGMFPTMEQMNNMGGMGNMANMGFNGGADFNQMMQFMPNGMPNNMMGSFPNAMGMSNMGMDPTAMSQGLYGGFSGSGMGMNGMSMGMGFDAGQNTFGGFNGQPQNNNAYGSMGGNFGANAGYGGYNMTQQRGHYNQMNQHQNFNHDFSHGQHHPQGFPYRGRGRGRGYYMNAGRGRGYVPPYQSRHNVPDVSHDESSQLPIRRGSPDYGPLNASGAKRPASPKEGDQAQEVSLEDPVSKDIIEEQLKKEFAPGDAEDNLESATNVAGTGGAKDEILPGSGESSHDTEHVPESEQIDPQKPARIPSVLEAENAEARPAVDAAEKSHVASAMGPPLSTSIPTGPASQRADFSNITSPRGRGFGRGFGRGGPDPRPIPNGRGSGYPNEAPARRPSNASSEQLSPTSEAKGLGVQGAPKAPKALRQGLPNTGVRQSQDTGFSIVGRATSNVAVQSTEYCRSKSPTFDRSRSHSRSRYHSPQRSSCHRHERHRSRSRSGERTRSRRQDRYERSSGSSPRGTRDYDDREQGDNNTKAEPVESNGKRPSHRSHRGHEDENEEEFSRSKHRSRRSHRNRSRSRQRDHRSSRKRSPSPELRINGISRTKESTKPSHSNRTHDNEDSGQSSRKRRDRGEDSSHRERKRSRLEEEEYPPEDRDDRRRSKQNGRDDRERHSRSERSGAGEARKKERSKSPPKGPKVDQHALEREARNRERQMKEIQRRALMEGKGSTARSKPNGRAGERKHSFRYEDDDLASRGERERESGRWG